MILVALLIAFLIVLLTGTIRAAGASLVRTPRADALRDAMEGDGRAAIVAELLENRPRVQPALGVFHAGLLVAASIPATWALTRNLDGWSLVVGLAAVGVLLVLIGDLIPRGIGRGQPRRLAYPLAWLLRPVVDLGNAAVDLVTDVDNNHDEPVSDEEEEDTVARELITSVLEFGDTVVREVMVPRPDMVTLSAVDTTDTALGVVIESRRSRIPVLGEGLDDVVGVLYARDLLKLHDDGAPSVACREAARSPYFVPETMPVRDLLREMQTNQVHLAIVVDEYGGTAGLVTIEDLLEELVGEIADEYDEEEPMATRLESGDYLIDARMALDELRQLIGVDLSAEEADTVGGLVLNLAGRVPLEGERFDLDTHVFIADRVQGRRIARVRLTRSG